MKSKKIILAGLILAGTWIFSAGLIQEPPEKKTAKGSFLRVDLLIRVEGKIYPPSRNIFRPKESGFAYGETDMKAGRRNRGRRKDKEMESAAGSTELYARYIGYVRSGDRIVALVIFNGEPMAVASGDFLDENFKLGMIARDRIVIIGPEDRRQEIPIEGDQ